MPTADTIRYDAGQRKTRFVVGRTLPTAFRSLPGRRIRTKSELVRRYSESARRAHLWFADDIDLFAGLKEGPEAAGSQHRLLILHPDSTMERREFLRLYFRSVDVLGESSTETVSVRPEELTAIVDTEHPDEYILQVTTDREDAVLLLLRGNLERIAVPFSWFTRRDPVREPDFSDVRIDDYGQTLELGEYDVDVDAILYDFDREYRARIRERELDRDPSFGASLRRLRLHKGLTQEDFSPVSARQIRRIEKGETESPRAETLQRIAARLGVEPEEIGTY